MSLGVYVTPCNEVGNQLFISSCSHSECCCPSFISLKSSLDERIENCLPRCSVCASSNICMHGSVVLTQHCTLKGVRHFNVQCELTLLSQITPFNVQCELTLLSQITPFNMQCCANIVCMVQLFLHQKLLNHVML